MKKYRIKNRTRFTAFLTILILTSSFISGSVLGLFNASSKDITKYTTVKVESGDTLWNLAKQYGSTNKDIREVIYEICKINNVSAESLQPGQFITIPQ